MAKERKPLPTIADADPTDKTALSSVFVPNPNKKAVKRTRSIIPARNESTTDDSGNTLIIPHGPQVTGTLNHIHNPLLHRTAGMFCQGKGKNVCSYPATDAVRNTARPRGSAIGVCKNCLGKMTHEAIKAGHELEVTKLTPKNTQDLKKLQAQEAEKSNWKVAATLYEQKVPEEDALAFNMAKTPGRPAAPRGGSAGVTGAGPIMNDEEAAAYNAERLKNKKGKKPTEYTFVQKPRIGKYKPPVKEEDAPIGEGSGTMDEVYRMYKSGDSNWMSKAKEYGVHPNLITRNETVTPVKRNEEFMDKLLYTKAPERMEKAISNVSEDQAEQVIQANAQNKMAERARALQAKRTSLPGSRPGLPSRRNTPFQLGSGENKGIEPPK
jgi:hypothetical protein